MVEAIIESDSANDPDGDIHRMYIPNVFAEKFAQALAREYGNIVLHSVSYTHLTLPTICSV